LAEYRRKKKDIEFQFSAYWVPEYSPREGSIVLLFLHSDCPVHQDVLDPLGVLVRVLEGGLVDDPLRIHDSYVGVTSGLDKSSAQEAVAGGGEGSHPPDAVLEAEELFPDHILAQEPGESPLVPGVGLAFPELPIGR